MTAPTVSSEPADGVARFVGFRPPPPLPIIEDSRT